MGNLPDGIAAGLVARGNRLKVDPFLRVPGLDGVYAIGDAACMACEEYPDGHPMVAQVAIQQARLLAKNFDRERRGKALDVAGGTGGQLQRLDSAYRQPQSGHPSADESLSETAPSGLINKLFTAASDAERAERMRGETSLT